MTRREATRLSNRAERDGWHDPELIKWDTGGYSVSLCDPATGIRVRCDSLSAYADRLQERKEAERAFGLP